jgi:hypothetical protein
MLSGTAIAANVEERLLISGWPAGQPATIRRRAG